MHLGKGTERVTFQWRHLTDATSARWSRSKARVKSHIDSMSLYRTWYLWHLTSVILFPKHSPNLIMRETPANSTKRRSTNIIPDQDSSELSRSSETQDVWETVRARRSLRRHDDYLLCGALGGTQEQKKGTWVKSMENEPGKDFI